MAYPIPHEGLSKFQLKVIDELDGEAPIQRLKGSLQRAWEAQLAAMDGKQLPPGSDMELDSLYRTRKIFWAINSSYLEEVRAHYYHLANFGRREEAIETCRPFEELGLKLEFV